MKNTLKKIWDWINGNKTIIGSLLLAASGQWGSQVIPNQNLLTLINGVIVLLTGASLVHHVKKGYFTTKKGT
jgi:hypothetical protein